MSTTFAHAVDNFFRDYERPITGQETGEVGTDDQQGTADRGNHQYSNAGQHGQTDTNF